MPKTPSSDAMEVRAKSSSATSARGRPGREHGSILANSPRCCSPRTAEGGNRETRKIVTPRQWRSRTAPQVQVGGRRESSLVAAVNAERIAGFLFNCSKHLKSSSKTQIAAYLLMILAVAERGDSIPLPFSIYTFCSRLHCDCLSSRWGDSK